MSTPDSNPPQLPPIPVYGEYASPAQAPFPPQQQPYAPQYGQHPYYAPQYGTKPPLRTADMIISIVLLAFGFFGALSGIGMAFQLEYAMQVQHDDYGLGAYEATSVVVGAQAAIIASHLLLLLISTPLTIVLILKRKISFWLPLTAGVLAAIVFWIALIVVIVADPALMEALQTPSQF